MADDDDELDKLWNTEVKPSASVHELKKPTKLVVHHTGKQPYVALATKDKVLSFVVHSISSGIRYSFAYHTLTSTAIHEPDADYLTIITNRAVIEVYGKNLLPIAVALELHTCHSINEFSPEMFLPPSDDSQPFIEKIEVLLPTPPKKQERVAKGKPEEQGA